MYLIHNEGKSVAAERFIKTLKTKVYKYMASFSKKTCIDKLDDIVNEYNNTYQRTINVESVDVKDNTYIDSMQRSNDKDPKFKVCDCVRTKYKHIFAKGYTPNWSEEVFVIKKVKNTVPRTYVNNDLNGDEIIGTFNKKNYKRLISKNLG